MMTMTITITPADLPLQLQWYAWVEFLQLLPCHCRLTRQHSYLQSYHTAPPPTPPYYLTPCHHLCLQSYDLIATATLSYMSDICPIHHHHFLSTTKNILSQSNSAFVVAKMWKYCIVCIQIFQNRYPEPKIVPPSGAPCQCHSPHLMCVPPLSRLTIRHSWAIQSGAMLSPLMGREWEDAGEEDHLGTTLGPPGPQSHKNLHSQAVSLVFTTTLEWESYLLGVFW